MCWPLLDSILWASCPASAIVTKLFTSRSIPVPILVLSTKHSVSAYFSSWPLEDTRVGSPWACPNFFLLFPNGTILGSQSSLEVSVLRGSQIVGHQHCHICLVADHQWLCLLGCLSCLSADLLLYQSSFVLSSALYIYSRELHHLVSAWLSSPRNSFKFCFQCVCDLSPIW